MGGPRHAAFREQARQAETSCAMVVMALGGIRTAPGGADALLSLQDSIPNLVDMLLSRQQRPGLEYFDYLGRTLPW